MSTHTVRPHMKVGVEGSRSPKGGKLKSLRLPNFEALHEQDHHHHGTFSSSNDDDDRHRTIVDDDSSTYISWNSKHSQRKDNSKPVYGGSIVSLGSGGGGGVGGGGGGGEVYGDGSNDDEVLGHKVATIKQRRRRTQEEQEEQGDIAEPFDDITLESGKYFGGDDENNITAPSSHSKSKHHSNNKYEVLHGLGRGGFSTVVKVRNQRDGQLYAMKVIPKIFSRSKAKAEKHQLQIRTEMNIMTQVSSSCHFLSRCFDVFESYSCAYFILELYSGGDLFYHLNNKLKGPGCFSEVESRFILAQIYLALEHFHASGYLHRDIKVKYLFPQEGKKWIETVLLVFFFFSFLLPCFNAPIHPYLSLSLSFFFLS
jgi:hypothetical protein